MALLSHIQQWWRKHYRLNLLGAITTNPSQDIDEPGILALSDDWPDEKLIRFFQNNTNETESPDSIPKALALDTLVERHSDALYHFLISLSDAQLAEDVFQMVWLKLIDHPHRYTIKKTASFKTWLFAVARNSLVDELRRQNRWQWSEISEDEVELEVESLNHNESWSNNLKFDKSEGLQDQFNQALDSMSFSQREALTLQLDEFSLKEIADITGENQETIKSRLRFARKHLKDVLEVENEL